MGTRILVGTYDGGSHDGAAAFVDSVTGTAFGPLIEAPDAYDQAEAFREWVASHAWRKHVRDVFGVPDIDGIDDTGLTRTELPHGGGDDPRHWSDAAFARLWRYWRSENVGDDGFMLDPMECECGHRHVAGPDDADAGCGSCACATWRPGNAAARRRHDETKEDQLVQ